MNPFVANPEWGWWIVGYFYLGGLAAGAYFAATLIEVFGRPADQPVARAGYRLALPLVAKTGHALEAPGRSSSLEAPNAAGVAMGAVRFAVCARRLSLIDSAVARASAKRPSVGAATATAPTTLARQPGKAIFDIAAAPCPAGGKHFVTGS